MFDGKALYNPKGRAGEYSTWAVNFYNGCSNGCTYCYLRRGVLAHVTGGDAPVLKKCFKDEHDALEIFRRELEANREAVIRDGGLLFSFSTDPCLPETAGSTMAAVSIAAELGVPCKVLTKCTTWIKSCRPLLEELKDLVAVGFTVTGRDDLEPSASPTSERIAAMALLHSKGIRIFASVEPVIDAQLSFNLMAGMAPFCDHFKVGLQSGRHYTQEKLDIIAPLADAFVKEGSGYTVYFKESIRPYVKAETLADSKCVDAGWNIFAELVKQPQ